MLVALAALILVIDAARNHSPVEAAPLLSLLAAVAFAARWLLRDLRLHPADFRRPDRLARARALALSRSGRG